MNHEQMYFLLLGILAVAFVCFDVFQSIIVPRLALRRFRLAPRLIGTFLWPGYRCLIAMLPADWRIGWLEIFAPLAFIFLLSTWLCCLIAGFACIIFSLGNFVSPPITQFSEAMYFAGTSVLTLGFGDLVAAAWPSRIVVLLAAVLGLFFMALTVSLLFSMLSYLQQREQIVNTIVSRAGVPPSGVVLLMRYRELNIMKNLSPAFVAWEQWLASIVESHRSTPLLMYFRSSTPTNSWLATVGATMDAASLLLTAVDDDWVGEADLYYWMGLSVLKAMTDAFRLQPEDEPALDLAEFDRALQLLGDAGYKVRDAQKIWPYFAARRTSYMRHLLPLSKAFESPLHVWLPVFKSLSASKAAEQ